MTRSPRSLRLLAACVALFCVLASAGCGGTADPKQRALRQRARWSVMLLDWSQSADGTVTLATRLSGPPGSDLTQLTVRVQLFDENETEIGRQWHTFDLSDVERGGPADKLIRIHDLAGEVAGAGIDPVLSPGPDEEAHIPELRG